MGLFDMFKSKTKSSSLRVPSAPPSIQSLPDIPSELPDFPEGKQTKIYSSIERFEKRAVREEKEELGEREHLILKKPIFVDLDLFKVMLDEIGLVKKNLKEMDDIVTRLDDFRNDKDKEFDKWKKAVEDIQRKLIYADRTLFGR